MPGELPCLTYELTPYKQNVKVIDIDFRRAEQELEYAKAQIEHDSKYPRRS